MVSEGFHQEVFASSAQYRDLKTGELLLPNKAGVIVSRASFDPNADEDYNRARAYMLGFHEMGHLPLGLEVCCSEECIFSHSYGSVDGMIRKLLEGDVPVCDLDKRRVEEFRKKWGI